MCPPCCIAPLSARTIKTLGGDRSIVKGVQEFECAAPFSIFPAQNIFEFPTKRDVEITKRQDMLLFQTKISLCSCQNLKVVVRFIFIPCNSTLPISRRSFNGLQCSMKGTETVAIVSFLAFTSHYIVCK